MDENTQSLKKANNAPGCRFAGKWAEKLVIATK